MIREKIIMGILAAGGGVMLWKAIVGSTNWYFGAVVFVMSMISRHLRGPK